ncbi:hypothetical protein [Paenibacillus rigui]|uniref:Uncharacterized protein n=1 Tax=Paenibacillus rigui TaxID=554312 RepID=A0A229URA3_9BACL|nr:hypothetical protein [Paenibacillus rigui]OXM85715.1 hypothetical protein CF651_14170 [Paenibacillus rigui]
MAATKYAYSLYDDLEKLDLGKFEARVAEWNGKKALYLEKMNTAVFLREEVPFSSFRLRIRPDFVNIPVQWNAGVTTIRAELTQHEFFGWGLALRTGLSPKG